MTKVQIAALSLAALMVGYIGGHTIASHKSAGTMFVLNDGARLGDAARLIGFVQELDAGRTEQMRLRMVAVADLQVRAVEPWPASPWPTMAVGHLRDAFGLSYSPADDFKRQNQDQRQKLTKALAQVCAATTSSPERYASICRR